MIPFIAASFSLASVESLAQSNKLDIERNKISVYANNGIDWNKSKSNFVAKGQAQIIITDQFDKQIKLKSDTIRLDYEGKDAKNVKLITSDGQSSLEIDNIILMSKTMVFDLEKKKLTAKSEPIANLINKNKQLSSRLDDSYDPKYAKIILDFENELDTIEITAIKIELSLTADKGNKFKNMRLSQDVKLINKDFTLSGQLGEVTKLSQKSSSDGQNINNNRQKKSDYLFSICKQVYMDLKELDISTNCATYNSFDKQISLRGRSNISKK